MRNPLHWTLLKLTCIPSIPFIATFLLAVCGITNLVYASDGVYGEYIFRKQGQQLFSPTPPALVAPPTYPWQEREEKRCKITKEFFRCKGDMLHPPNRFGKQSPIQEQYDCAGTHSLPLRNGKEYVYPLLLELLNYLADATKNKVVITSGHRCPQHHAYVTASVLELFSKHMIAAQVTFYIQGMEDEPIAVVELLQSYFATNHQYRGKKGYHPFERYDKELEGSSFLPWCNKEIFIKVFTENEGRNKDNNHPYPYIDMQVRIDVDTGCRITPSWQQAKTYLHY